MLPVGNQERAGGMFNCISSIGILKNIRGQNPLDWTMVIRLMVGVFGRDFGHGMPEDSADDVAIQMMSEQVSMHQPDANTTPMRIRDDGGWGE